MAFTPKKMTSIIKKQTASTFIDGQKDTILDSWLTLLHREVPATQHEERPVLINELPNFLMNLAKVLTQNQNDDLLRESVQFCREHGKQRARLRNYTLREVLFEYHLLRKTIAEALIASGTPVSDHEQEIISDAIDLGIAEAGEEFMEEQLSVERSYTESLKSERDLREKFIALLAHDLRIPITSVQMCSQLLLKNVMTAEKREVLLNQINSSVSRLDRMIKDLLDVSLIRAGKVLPLSFEECNLQTVIAKTGEELTAAYGSRIQVKADDPMNGFWAPEAVRRAVENLANNAIRYGDPIAPVLINATANENEIEISVHNEGRPIPQEIVATIYEPFVSDAGRTSSAGKGWGLGLTLVRGVVEAHAGRLHLISEQDKGTTFTLILPKRMTPPED